MGDVLRTSRSIQHSDGVGETPSGPAPARNPDRTLSSDCRLISDLRRAALGFRKEVAYPSLAPTVYDLIGEILQLKRQNRRANAIPCKRGIDGALSRLLLNRGMGKLITTDFREEDTLPPDDVVVRNLRYPCGRFGRNAPFCLITNAIGRKFRRFGGGRPQRTGYQAFDVCAYVEDAAFIELDLPSRMSEVVE